MNKNYENIIKNEEKKLKTLKIKDKLFLIRPDKKSFDSADYEKSRQILNCLKNTS